MHWGVRTVKIGIFSVIATIGTGFVVRGLSYSFTNGVPIYPMPESFAVLGSVRPLKISFIAFKASELVLQI